MHAVLDRLTRFYGWNLRVLGIEEFEWACEQEGVSVLSLDVDAHGIYTSIDGSPVIIINPRVLPRARGWVCWHEFGHHLLHCGSSCAFSYGGKSKTERQADLVAACALIPRKLIESSTPWEIHDAYRYPIELCEMRFRFLTEVGI